MVNEVLSFFRTTDGQHQAICIDAAAADQTAAFPKVIVVRLTVPAAGLAASGLPSRTTLAAIEAWQGQLEARFSRPARWPWPRAGALRPLSRRTMPGPGGAVREVAFGTASGATLASVRGWLTRHRRRAFAATVEEGSWEAHYWALVPSRIELHMSALQLQLREIAAEGIDVVLPARREHRLTADADGDLEGAARALRRVGFLAVRTGPDGLTCDSIEPLTPDAIRPVDATLLAVAEAHGLDYRGFELIADAGAAAAQVA